MTAYRPVAGLLVQVIDGRAAIVDAVGTRLLTLNPVGTEVWEALGRSGDVDHLVKHVLDVCDDVEEVRVRRDVGAFLAELEAAGLVTTEG